MALVARNRSHLETEYVAARGSASSPVRYDRVGASIAALTILWITRDIWMSPQQIITAWDTSALIARTDGIVHDVLAQGHLDGWYDGFFVGHDATLFNGPGFALIAGFLSLISFGAIDTTEAITIMTCGSLAALPFAVAYMARCFGADPLVAGIAAIGSLGVSFFAGAGIEGAFEVGLLPQTVATPFAVAAIGAAVMLLRSPNAHHARRCGCFVAATALIHPVSLTVLALLLLVLFVVEMSGSRIRTGAVLRVPHAIVIAVGLSAVWLLPALVMRDELGVAAAFDQPGFGQQLSDMLSGEAVFGGWLGPAVLFGALVCVFVPAWRAIAGPALMTALGYVVAAHVIRSTWPEDLTIHLTLRATGYVAYLALIAPALVLGGLRRFSREAVVAFFTLWLATMTVLNATSPIRETIDTNPIADRDLRAAAIVLSNEVPDWGRFAVDESWEARELHGVENLAHWLVASSGVSSFNGFNPETSASAVSPLLRELDVGNALNVAPGTERSLSSLGVTHLVSFDPASDAWALGSALYESPTVRINQLSTSGPFTVVDIVGPLGQTAEGDLDLVDLQYSPGELHAQVDTTSAVLVDAAVGFSPRWHLAIDGEATPIVRTPAGTVSFEIPQGSHVIELDYRLGRAHNLGFAISLLSVVAIATGFALRASRRRARSDTPLRR